MRIAACIIALILMIPLAVQTLAAGIGGGLSEGAQAEEFGAGAAAGFMCILLFLLGGALVIPWPLVSFVLFGLAGLIALAGAAASPFDDLFFYMGAAFVLAAMAFFGWIGKRKERRRERIKEQVQAERDARYEALLAAQTRPTMQPPQSPTGVQSAAPCPLVWPPESARDEVLCGVWCAAVTSTPWYAVTERTNVSEGRA